MGKLYVSGMGCHGNILKKTNAGAGEAEIEGLIYWRGGATDKMTNFVACLQFAIRRCMITWSFKHPTPQTMGSGIMRLCNGDVR